MSHSSENTLPIGTSLKRLKEIIDLLGYRPAKSWYKSSEEIGGYMWYEHEDYKSWSGVELTIYRENDILKVYTRTTVSRSYWDLTQQNRTIKLIRDVFGGGFETDLGSGRYLRPASGPPLPIASGCYLARWSLHNALAKANFYLSSRKLEGAKEESTGVYFLDDFNPRLLSNNLLIPFVLAVWEEYFRATFTVVLKYSEKREAVLKKARLSHVQMEQIAAKKQVERAIAECFSFQRPSLIGENFKLIDSRLDLAASMRKPYRKRKITLFESIEGLVEGRNDFVHAGNMDMALYDRQLRAKLDEVVEAADRSYDAIGQHFNFTPIRDY